RSIHGALRRMRLPECVRWIEFFALDRLHVPPVKESGQARGPRPINIPGVNKRPINAAIDKESKPGFILERRMTVIRVTAVSRPGTSFGTDGQIEARKGAAVTTIRSLLAKESPISSKPASNGRFKTRLSLRVLAGGDSNPRCSNQSL